MTSATVRDRLFLIAHDEERGLSPHVRPELLDFGLAGAVLIDLLLARCVSVQRERVLIGRWRGYTGDVITDSTMQNLITRGASVPVRDFIFETAPTMYLRVQGILVAGGVLRPHRRWLRAVGYRSSDQGSSVIARATVRDLVLAAAHQRPIHHRAGSDALAALVRALRLYAPLALELPDSQIRALLDENTIGIRNRAKPDTPAYAVPYVAGCLEDVISEYLCVTLI
jgi:hypothetical protein